MATTTNFGWETPDDTDLVKDGALAMRTLGNAIDASLVDLKGGTTGQVLAKASNTDLDFTWSSVDPLTILDAKGDLISATAADTPARLAVGTNGQVLTADSSTSTGLKWASPAGGGKVLQVVSSTTTAQTSIATTTLTDTGITATITPSATNSKILIIVSMAANVSRLSNRAETGGRLLRGATQIMDFTGQGFPSVRADGSTLVEMMSNSSITYLDSPSTTSATTYKVQAKVMGNGNSETITINGNTSASTITLLEIGA